MSRVVPDRVSVVVPLYNYAGYVESCLESALEQDYPDVDIVVVDDGSDDGGPAIVERYASRGVRLVRQARCGYGSARALNRAIVESTGEYVAWLSADDRMTPGRLSRQVALLKEAHRRDSSIGWVFGESVLEIVDEPSLRFSSLPVDQTIAQWQEHGVVRWVQHTQPDVLAHPEYWLMRRNILNGCTTLMRREVLDRVGLFDESMPRTADYEMWTRLYANGCRAVYDAEPSVFTRIHAVNTRDWAGECETDATLVTRMYHPQMLARALADFPAEERPSRLRDIGDELWGKAIVDLAARCYRLCEAMGLDGRSDRIVQSRSLLSLPTAQRVAESRAMPRLVMPALDTPPTARFGQIARLLIDAATMGRPCEVVVWVNRESLGEPLGRAFAETHRLLGSPPSPPRVRISTENLAECFAGADAVIPIGTAVDAPLVDLAERMGVPVLYSVNSEAMSRLCPATAGVARSAV